MKTTFSASKYKVTEDSEGEITLVLKVPQSDAAYVLGIPTQELLHVTIEVE